MKALIDGDILRYEVGFAAEQGWQGSECPPWDYVGHLLIDRLNRIYGETKADSYTLFLTEGKTFRYDIARSRPYKGTRVENKPWHFSNLTIYMRDVLGAEIVTGIEADDAMAIEHTLAPQETIICTRDKDLRQVPGWFYSWECGKQPSFGPYWIPEKGGELWLTERALQGTGYAWFCAQLLMGDPTDNIPGLPGWGPKRTYDLLAPIAQNEMYRLVNGAMFQEVCDAYADKLENWEQCLLEQGQLLWMVRRLNEGGTPELWRLGQDG